MLFYKARLSDLLFPQPAKGFVHVTRQADGADGYCGDARELLRPAGKVQLPIDLREGGLPEFWLREMEGVRTSFDEHGKPLFQRLRRFGKACAEVFRLPLRKAKNHREAG